MNDLPASFREVQGFRQWWLWVLMLITALGTIGVFGYGIYVQVIEGIPWSDNPTDHRGPSRRNLRLILPDRMDANPFRDHRFVPDEDLSPDP